LERKEDIQNLLKLCEDLQEIVHLREGVTVNVHSLSYSCDLLLRNMIMILEKEKNGDNFTEEMKYLKNNILGAHAHLTDNMAIDTALKYKLKKLY
jgi:hypothetical protein